jgi:hypothetical protein
LLTVFDYWISENGEDIQVLRYEHGQKYDPHFDYFADKVNIARGGHRVATVLMYLTNVTKGGETVFPNAEVCLVSNVHVYIDLKIILVNLCLYNFLNYCFLFVISLNGLESLAWVLIRYNFLCELNLSFRMIQLLSELNCLVWLSEDGIYDYTWWSISHFF